MGTRSIVLQDSNFALFCFRRSLTATFSGKIEFSVVSLNGDKAHCVAGSVVEPEPEP